jgi:hypothetical protein
MADLAARATDPEEKKNFQKRSNIARSKGNRMCVNAPVQGGAADYIKMGMIRTQKAIKEAGLQDKIRLVMTIHDALEFYVHESVSTQTVIDLINPMVSFPVQGLPEILAEWHEGRRWGEVVEIQLDGEKQIVSYSYKTKINGQELKCKFPTIEEVYEWQDNPPVPKPEPSFAPEPEKWGLVIEFDGDPIADEWEGVKEELESWSDESGIEVHVRLGDDKKILDLKVLESDDLATRLKKYLSNADVFLDKVN